MSELFFERSSVLARLCVAAVCLCGLLIGSHSTAYAADGPGKKAFQRVCAECHGDQGEGADGPPIAPPPHAAQEVLNIARSGRGNMPLLPRATITDEEILAVIAYLEAPGKE